MKADKDLLLYYYIVFTVTYPEGFSNRYAGMSAQILQPKKGSIAWFAVISSIAGYVFSFFFLRKVCFQIRNYTLSIANHHDAKNTCSLKGFHPMDNHQHFNIGYYVRYCLSKTIYQQGMVCPKNLWIRRWFMKKNIH